MSESSPYQAPASAPPSSAASQRPTGVTVFGILSILLGLFGLFGVAASIIMLVARNYVEFGPNPMMDHLDTSVGYAIFTYVTTALGAIATILLIVAGVGMLMMKPWSRKLSVVYSLYMLAAIVVGLIVHLSLLVPTLGQMDSGQEKVTVWASLISMVLGSVVSLAYPLALLIYCWRPATIATFERWR